jgi:flavin-dependent dehydrogenase
MTVDLTDRNGTSITGLGWVFPLGDGTVNVGCGVVSTAKDFRAINTTHLLEQFATDIAERWRIQPDAPLGAPASGRVPMGGSVGPAAGPTWLVVGDAAGSANPFVGTGIEYAYETGRIAGDVLDEALRENNATVLQRFPAVLAATYVTKRSSIADNAVRLACNELRPSRPGPAEIAYRVAGAISRFAPRA